MRIGIIGGGISGVSLAAKLSILKKGGTEADITLLEASPRLGGTIDSVHKDGYVIEAGTNGFLDSKPFTYEAFKEAGLDHKLVKSNDSARKRYIQRYGALQRMPENAPSFFASKLLTFKGKARLACEFFVPRKNDGEDETLANFARRRLGEESLDYLIGPMVSGVFAGDPEKMSLRSCFPVIADLETQYGGLIKGLLKKRNKKSGPAGPGGTLTAYEGGMGCAVKDLAAFAEKNGVKIRTNSRVSSVSKESGVYTVDAPGGPYEFDVLAVTCPAYESSEFLKNLDPELAAALSTIPYAPMFVAGLGFNSEDMKNPIDGFGYLIPAKENRKILGALFTSSMFPDQAPKGKKFLRVMCGGAAHSELVKLPDEELLNICIEGVTDVLEIVGRPHMIQTFNHEFAIPQYTVGHCLKVKAIENAAERHGNLYIGGNVLYGIGLNDCTKTSKIIAEKITESTRAGL